MLQNLESEVPLNLSSSVEVIHKLIAFLLGVSEKTSLTSEELLLRKGQQTASEISFPPSELL